ncbi:signal peptidase I [Candidatus Uhrbacteria bacterium]|nr:signal peptidase I [Candidatus Uhrbacteria bacterium]
MTVTILFFTILLLVLSTFLYGALLYAAEIILDAEKNSYKQSVVLAILATIVSVVWFGLSLLFKERVPEVVLGLLGIFYNVGLFIVIIRQQLPITFMKALGIYVISGIFSLVLVFFAVFITRLFVVQSFFVKGTSMNPTYQENDYLLINKIDHNYQRGDVVVYRQPVDEKKYLVHRLIGLPGERIVIKDKQITVYAKDKPDGFVLQETGYQTFPLRDVAVDTTLKSDEYFVLGDNRPSAMDSTVVGPIARDRIVGKVGFKLPKEFTRGIGF